MSAYPKHVWDQLRNTTFKKFQAALKRDGWILESTPGAVQIYRHPDRPEGKNVVSVHSHPSQVIRRGTLKSMLDSAGWTTEEDFIRVKLISKGKGKRKGLK